MISVAEEALPVPGTPRETSTPIGSAPSAARSDSAAAVARHPISRNDSQSVRKCTPSTLRSMLKASVVPPPPPPPNQINPQSSPKPRPADPSRAKMRRGRGDAPPPPSRGGGALAPPRRAPNPPTPRPSPPPPPTHPTP